MSSTGFPLPSPSKPSHILRAHMLRERCVQRGKASTFHSSKKISIQIPGNFGPKIVPGRYDSTMVNTRHCSSFNWGGRGHSRRQRLAVSYNKVACLSLLTFL